MGSTSKRAATTSVCYTFSEEDEQDVEVRTVKSGRKKKKEEKLKTVVCKICHKKYTDNEGLRRHMELHTDALDYACDECDARFKTSQYLGRHRKRVHSTPSHECEYCGKRFTMPSKLDQHRLVHTGEKPHKCEVCGKAFRAIYSLNTHRLMHTNEKPYKCQYCPYACRDNSTLRRHHERHEGTLKWHECSYCDKKYYSKPHLKRHVSEQHFAVDLKVIPCSKCDLRFKTNAQLNTHIKVVHERALRAECEVCGVEISNRNNMAAHLRKHIHVRPYKCKVKECQKRFKDVGTLKKHSLIHKPSEQHACEVCGKLFARRHRLNVHMRRHGDDTNTKVMFCDYCGFSFDNKPRLIRHMLKHIRHRHTYVCDVCKYITHRKRSIETHMQYGHGDAEDRYCKICDKSYKLHAYLILHYYNRHGIRYKTLKNIKLETSVTIKEEPQEPIPDAEVDLEEIQKQEPLADIITDVALDCDATDISYSKSVLNEDIQRSARQPQLSAARGGFRRKLRGRAALIDDEKTLYARKEKDVKKRINRLLARVRHKKWARAIERARRRYNQRIRTASSKAHKDTENNIKVKFVNMNRANNNKKTETDQNKNNDNEFKNNTINSVTEIPKEDTDRIITANIGEECSVGTRRGEGLVQESNIRGGGSNSSVNQIDRDENNMTYDETDTVESFLNDIGTNREDVRNIYEDVLDIEENPVGKMNDEDIDTDINDKEINNSRTDNLEKIRANIDPRNRTNATVDDIEDIVQNVTDSHENDSANRDSNTQNTKDDNNKKKDVELKNNVTHLESKLSSVDNLNLKGKVSSKENNLSISLKANNIEDSDQINSDSKESNSEKYQNGEEEIMGSDEERDRIINDQEKERGKNVKLKINTHQCYVCHKLYETQKKLLEHCQEHFDICTDIPLKKCPLCNYVTKRTITQHLKLVHDVTITLPYHTLHDKNKYTEDKSRYCYNIDDKVVKEIEIIPSVRNLNKRAYVEIDKNNRRTKDLAVAKTKLVKKSGEWVVETEKMNVNNEFLLPKFDKKEIKRLKHVGDDYLDIIKVLGRLAKRHKAKMLYPCNGCEKLCQTFAALKLHSRRHEANPKPFKKKVWKHKLKPNELKALKTRNNRIKKGSNKLRQAKPKPIENKHKCDKKLMEFYENNVKGADIEFWQFLKIYNRMNKDHENLERLQETNEFGDYIEIPSEIETTRNDVETMRNNDVATQNVVVTSQNNKTRLSYPKVSNKFTRKNILSKEERLRRARIKEQLRQKNTENK